MINKRKRIISIIIIAIITLLISGYVIYTFPHAFIEENNEIKMVMIGHRELIPFKDSTKQSLSLEDDNEIGKLIEVLNKYRYRYYIDIGNHNSGFIDETSEIRIDIYYNNGKSDCILMYSDGQLFINYKPSHIGILGDQKAKEMYTLLYDKYFR